MRKLSKSRYIIGLQCVKNLWLGIHKPELGAPLDEGTKHIMDMGTLVGEYARKRFKGGVLITEDHEHLADAIRATEKAVADGASAIYEATAAFGNVLSRTDILLKKKNEWDLYEVKSSTSVKDYHLDDVSFQRHCFEGAGFCIRKTYLMHVNNKYVRQGTIDPKALFVAKDITETVLEKMKGIEDRVENMVGVINRNKCPRVEPGEQCLAPFVCPFFDLCNERRPYDIYELPSGGRLAPQLAAMGVRYLKDIPDDVPLSDRQRKTVMCARSKKPVVNTKGIHAFLKTLEYPLYYFDFETIASAVPMFDNSRPYENIPFQFSLHIQKRKDGPVVHYDFLHDKKSDPRKPLIRKMLKLLKKKGSIIAYNMSFEKTVIANLMADLPEYSKKLKDLLPRFQDLIIPFRKGLYVHRDFHGSASIKSVLPVMVPSLSYKELEIQEGGSASLAYENWMRGEMTDKEWKRTHRALLKYCKLDTLAMVEILKVLGVIRC